MPDAVIEVTGVARSFGGHRVLDGLELSVARGQVYAFLGRNGAGKSSTLRLLMGLLPAERGTIRVLGLDPAHDALAIRQRVGYLAEDQQMWGWMRVREIMRFLAPFYPTWDMARAVQLVEQFGLPPDAKIATLSKGQNVRLGLLLALAHRPELLILDDPALGLDPVMRKEFLRDIVSIVQDSGATVLFSSHLLYEVEPVADVVGILHGGRLVRQAPTDELRARVQQVILSAEQYAHAELHGVLDVKRAGARVAAILEDAPATIAALRRAGVVPEVVELNLDEIFEAYVVGERPARGPEAVAAAC